MRAAARRRRGRRGAAIAAVSTVVVLGTLTAVIVTSPGWDAFAETFLSVDAFRTSFPRVLDGFWLDVKLFLVVEVVVLIVGLLIALARTGRAPALFPLRALAVVWVDVFRGIPTILMVYLVGFGIPALALKGVPTDPVLLGGLGLTLSYSAYVAEVYRAGLESIEDRQRAAALAVGLTPTQSLRFVVVPQALRRIAPPLLNDFIALQKDVALVSILGPLEAFRVAQIDASSNFNYTPLLAAAVLYLAVTIPLARLLDYLRARQRRQRNRRGRMTAVLEARGVTKAYGEREVLKGIDVAVEPHRALALIGASGSGKSTLLRCLDLLEEIDDGDVLLDGEVVTEPGVDVVGVRRRLGMVFQGFDLFSHLDVLDNVTLGLRRAHGMDKAAADERGRELLARFGLEGRERDRPDRLSGGQQQRVAIARALAHSPRALLLDEITSALDPELVGEVLAAVADLKREGMTMVIATHEMAFARDVADEVCFLHEGRILERGAPAEVLVSPREPETRRFLARFVS